MSNCFKPSAIGPYGCLLIEKDRNLEFIADPPADELGQFDTLFHRDAPYRHKRQHIRGADPRVLAFMNTKINQPSGGLSRLEGCFRNRKGTAGKGDDGAVMIGIVWGFLGAVLVPDEWATWKPLVLFGLGNFIGSVAIVLLWQARKTAGSKSAA